VFFPHSQDEFGDEYDLRDWLAGSLRLEREGRYRLKQPSGLDVLEKGSIVFFVKNHLAVGCAIVEEGLKSITSKDRKRYGWTSQDDLVYKEYIKFLPESIWAFPSDRFISTQRITKVLNKGFGQGFTMINDLDQLLQVFALV